MKKRIGNLPSDYQIAECPCGCKIKRLVRNDRIISGHIFAKGHWNYNNGFTFNKLRNRWYVMDRKNLSTPFSRVIAECVLKRELNSQEIVHHINGNSANDVKNNLLICTKEYHNFLHSQMKRVKGPWSKDRSYLNII